MVVSAARRLLPGLTRKTARGAPERRLSVSGGRCPSPAPRQPGDPAPARGTDRTPRRCWPGTLRSALSSSSFSSCLFTPSLPAPVTFGGQDVRESAIFRIERRPTARGCPSGTAAGVGRVLAGRGGASVGLGCAGVSVGHGCWGPRVRRSRTRPDWAPETLECWHSPI